MPSQLNIAPMTEPLVDMETGKISSSWKAWFSQMEALVRGTSEHWTTANRPTAGLFIGRSGFNNTLGRVDNWDGNSWVDESRNKMLEIGTWNMVTTASVSIPHGLTFSKIRIIAATIRHDNGNFIYNLAAIDESIGSIGGRIRSNTTNVILQRETGGVLDSTDFDIMSGDGNRGWVYIVYED